MEDTITEKYEKLPAPANLIYQAAAYLFICLLLLMLMESAICKCKPECT